MAKETVTKSKRFYCVSTVPDICKTPIGASTPPIPYNVIGEFSETAGASRNVKANSEPVFLTKKSKIPSVKGDVPGKAGGIKSGTVGKQAEAKTNSSTLRVNGAATTQVNRTVWMNAKNTLGTIYERGEQAARRRLVGLAKWYKDSTISDSLHGFGEEAMDKGGKVVMGSGALAAGGVAVAATGVGAPVGAAMGTAAAAGATVGGVVTATGAAADSLATIADNAADAILSGREFDVSGTLQTVGMRLANNVIAKKTGGVISVGKKTGAKAAAPNKQSQPANKPADPPKKQGENNNQQKSDGDGSDGGKTKTKGKKGKKGDKPSDCCPKNSAPGGKPVSTKKPVHLGTGEEVLYQTDFEIPGPIPITWTRCYRSGSECEDWGLMGARWGSEFTASLSLCAQGIVYHDSTGRALRLPLLEPGQSHDKRSEGFILSRPSRDEFTITWRDNSVDTFRRAEQTGWLPHGYDGVNAMEPPGRPLEVVRFWLTRSVSHVGQGYTVQHNPDATPGEALLVVKTDFGLMVEAIRAPSSSEAKTAAPRIDSVFERRASGERICHVRYAYEAEPIGEPDETEFGQLAIRYNLVRQTNRTGASRTYEYRDHLLKAYTDYLGFARTLEWVSLGYLREKWAGRDVPNDTLLANNPITLNNSYQARAVATHNADGADGTRIEYVDQDTTRLTEASGAVLEYSFDHNFLATEVFRLSPSGTRHSLGRREWDSDGMLLAEINGAGHKTSFSYDAAGNLILVQDALMRATRFEYDANNQPITIIDAIGSVTRMEYDEHGQLIAQTDALGNVTRYRYDAEHRLIGLQDAKGGNKKTDYDSAGRVTAFTDCSGYRTLYRYDEAGRIAVVLDALEQPTRYEYNEAGWLSKVHQPDNTSEHFDYDAEGRLITHTDAAGHQTHYRYNGHGLALERIDALGYKVQYRYDEMLRLTELINQNGESYYFSYDEEGRLLTETGFDGLVTKYTYDQAGHMTAAECGGRVTELRRDLLGQLQAKITDDGVCRFSYDPLGRLTTAMAPHAYNEFRYDAVGQLLEERCAYFISPAQPNLEGPHKPDAEFVLSHAYDELSNRVQTILPTGERTDILRYGSGHWHGTLLNGESIVDIERDRLHREKLRRYGTAQVLTAARNYDPVSRITRMTIERKGAVAPLYLCDRKLKYDLVGNLLEIANGDVESVGPTSHWAFTYDPVGQLISAVKAGLSEHFAYDPAGNPIEVSRADEIKQGRQTQHQPPPSSTIVRHNQTKRYQQYEFSYDVFGNVTQKRRNAGEQLDTLDLSYDSENRVASAVRTTNDGQAEAQYIYDGFSRRIAKVVSEKRPSGMSEASRASPTSALLYIWDGNTLVQESTGTQTTSYLYEPESFIPLARIHSRRAEAPKFEVDFYDCDHLGTPASVLTQEGTAVWSGSYLTWGRLESTCDVNLGKTQPIRAQGQYFDGETALHYNRYRYIDPLCGRFLTQDPLGLLGGFNAYSFAPNPTGWTDPLGLKGCGSNPSCDPCYGVNPAKWARQWQGRKDYPGKDVWTNVVLPAGTRVYGGAPGQSGFYFDEITLRGSGFEKQRLYESLQVKANKKYGYRPRVQEYRLKKDTCVAVGIATAQDRDDFGTGGGAQIFLPNYKSALERVGAPILMR